MAKKKQDMPEEIIKTVLMGGCILAEASDRANELYNQSRFGEIKDSRLQISMIEGLYLLERQKIAIYDGRNHMFNFEAYLKKAAKLEPNIWVRFVVFRDLRNRGYIVKTALKFGADFRVYDRGIKPGEDHAKWVVYPVHEGTTLTWYEFAAKNRVAHSTKKRLLLGVVDDEGDVSYWECRWMRP
jgi:tRNA-intron endonuclease